ncbi:MAG: hypothetical protein MZV64_11935 [Ignavibacteriales bacterium]|nr:hypothetical protein [Ignavibacteriales bacterium]
MFQKRILVIHPVLCGSRPPRPPGPEVRDRRLRARSGERAGRVRRGASRRRGHRRVRGAVALTSWP